MLLLILMEYVVINELPACPGDLLDVTEVTALADANTGVVGVVNLAVNVFT